MTWGKCVPDPKTFSPDAPEDSDEAVLYRLQKFYPGSWLPESKEQITAAASGRLALLHSNNGRLDYIETLNRWGELTKNLYRPAIVGQSLIKALSLVPKYLLDSDFRTQLASVRHNDQQVCFQREIMSHERLFFELEAA
jgi:cyclopropane-fatty-acyl-phospholipid synthase